MLDLQKILVPIDASDNSLNALKFAKEFAEVIGGAITVMHAGPYYDTFEGGVALINENEIREKRIEYITKRVATVYQEEAVPAIRYEVGFPVDVIELASKDADMIIMGCSEEHGFTDRLLGSVSSGVAQNAHCPVLLVPEGQGALESLKVMFACQTENLDLLTIEMFLNLANNKSVLDVDFVEVVKPGVKGLLQSKVEEIVTEKYSKELKYSVHSLEGESVVDTLNEHAANNKVGIIVMVTQHRNLLQNMFHRSQTKRMVMNLEFPLLVLHSNYM